MNGQYITFLIFQLSFQKFVAEICRLTIIVVSSSLQVNSEVVHPERRCIDRFVIILDIKQALGLHDQPLFPAFLIIKTNPLERGLLILRRHIFKYCCQLFMFHQTSLIILFAGGLFFIIFSQKPYQSEVDPRLKLIR